MSTPNNDTARICITCDPIFEPGVFLSLAAEHENKQGIKYICFDLQFVEFLHSPGLAELIRTYTHLQKRNITLQLTNLADINRTIMQRTNLDQLIEIID